MSYQQNRQGPPPGRMLYGGRPAYQDAMDGREEMRGGRRPERETNRDTGSSMSYQQNYQPPPPRMAYGGQPSYQNELDGREELFRGDQRPDRDPRGGRGGSRSYQQDRQPTPPRMAYGGQPAYEQELEARDELFSGAQGGEQAMDRPMSNKEMLQMGVRDHQETTARAKHALQIINQTNQVADTTLVALDDQRMQMARIDADVNKIGQDLSYSERILRYMRLCCCVGFFCSCCTEPERNARDTQWRDKGGKSRGHQQQQQQKMGPMTPQEQQMYRQQQQQRKGNYPGVNTQGLDDDARQAIDAETQQQDNYLDQIDVGLEQIKAKAIRMNEELREQEATTDNLHGGVTAINSRMRGVNKGAFKGI